MTNPYEGSVSVDAQASMSFGGGVRTVLDTPTSQPPRHPRGGPQPAR